MFAKELREIEEELTVPYPERTQLIKEIAGDLHASFERLRQQGMSHEAARVEALRLFRFSSTEQLAIEVVHANFLQRIWLKLPNSWRYLLEIGGCMFPLVAVMFIIQTKVSMFNLILEGGVEGMLAIMVIGLFMLGRELIRVIRLLLLKQHSRKNLNFDTNSVLLGVAALVIFSGGLSLLGLYNTLLAVELKNDYSLLVIGARESMVPLVFGTMMSSLVLFAHYGLKMMLHRWGAIGERV
ncbi:MAG TPA: hypothetical protein VE954_09940 [Oligoflexus sp.]|uniref:hypothetical protein n=1 Tax=Oligoflexus sp. TaxID=1971216 RepID=UPI002D372B73|nr:hypothetical protein [Oligoflexus sp.]HYX33423.1 hypothetical protein [Oligoflexus sp.]